MSSNPEGLLASRYRLLVEQMRDELHARRGWKEEVARRLGVSGAFIGMLERGDREGGGEAAAKAQKRLGLDFRFFHDPDLERPAYRDFIVRGPEAHWQNFKQRYKRIGELTAKQLTEIRDFAARNLRVQTWTDYERLADMVLRDQESPTFERERSKR